MRILVVEDEAKIAKEVGLVLEAEGFRVDLCASGEDAYFRAANHHYDAIILDRMLPGRDGIEVLRTLRQSGCHTPILMLTAVGSVDDRVEGLSAGADDYVVKPFALNEVIARVRALLRRGAEATEHVIVRGPLRIDIALRRVTLHAEHVPLSNTEWELLLLLARSPGAAVSRDAIVHQLWPEHTRGASTDNLIDVHIGRLRRKLERDGLAPIRTVRGLGFLLETAS